MPRSRPQASRAPRGSALPRVRVYTRSLAVAGERASAVGVVRRLAVHAQVVHHDAYASDAERRALQPGTSVVRWDCAFQIDDTMFGEGTEMRAGIAAMADFICHGMRDEIGQRLLDDNIHGHAAHSGDPFGGADSAGPLLRRVHRASKGDVSILDTRFDVAARARIMQGERDGDMQVASNIGV